jgi:hypothetical protein
LQFCSLFELHHRRFSELHISWENVQVLNSIASDERKTANSAKRPFGTSDLAKSLSEANRRVPVALSRSVPDP